MTVEQQGNMVDGISGISMYTSICQTNMNNRFMFVKTLVGTRQWGMQTSIKQQRWLVPIDCDAEVQMRNKMSFVPNECCEDVQIFTKLRHNSR